jgi:hypothetical protein
MFDLSFSMSVVWTGILASCLAIVEVVVLWAVWAKRADRPAFAMAVRGLDGLVPERFCAADCVMDRAARMSLSTAPPGSSSQVTVSLIRLQDRQRRASGAPPILLKPDRS